MRRFQLLVTITVIGLLALPACSKKKKEAPAAKEKAGAATAKGAEAAKTGESADKTAKASGAASSAAAKPAPADVQLKAGDSVVAWVTLRSLSAVFDAAETIGGQVGALPPGVSLRDGFYRDLTRAFADQGISGHEWLDKAKPVHVFLQDDNPADLTGGVVVMLPMTSEAAAKKALKDAKTGAEAGGHAAMLKPVAPGARAPSPTAPEIYLDFLGTYMIVTSNKERFAKSKAFASRIAAVKSPALAYVGLSIADAAKTRKPQIDMLLSQFAKMEASAASKSGTPGYSSKMLRQWVTELTRLELTIDGDAGYVRLASRLHAASGSELSKQLLAGKGRDARDAAASLPGNAFVTFVADMDPKAGLNQLQQSMKVLKELFKFDEAKVASMKKDLDAAAKLQNGKSALAMYRDGGSIGALAWFGTADPIASLKVIKTLIAEIGLSLIAQEKQRKGKRLSKAEEAQFAVVERALRAQNLEPVLTTYGPVAREMGVTVTTNANNDGGSKCDVLDIAMDWKKLARPGDKEAAMAQKFLGERTAVALCTGKDRVSLTVGPSALEQGRRAALGKKGGLIDAPVYAASAKRTDVTPSTFMYLNLGSGLAAFKDVIPPLPVTFPADRPVSLHCGNRSESYACSLSLPVQAIAAAMTLARGR